MITIIKPHDRNSDTLRNLAGKYVFTPGQTMCEAMQLQGVVVDDRDGKASVAVRRVRRTPTGDGGFAIDLDASRPEPVNLQRGGFRCVCDTTADVEAVIAANLESHRLFEQALAAGRELFSKLDGTDHAPTA